MLGEDEVLTIEEMRRVLSKIDEMTSQRTTLLCDLEAKLRSDEVTADLLSVNDIDVSYFKLNPPYLSTSVLRSPD